jgi:hypothetical protein
VSDKKSIRKRVKSKRIFESAVTAEPRKLDSLADLERPNVYLHDWAQLAMNSRKATP